MQRREGGPEPVVRHAVVEAHAHPVNRPGPVDDVVISRCHQDSGVAGSGHEGAGQPRGRELEPEVRRAGVALHVEVEELRAGHLVALATGGHAPLDELRRRAVAYPAREELAEQGCGQPCRCAEGRGEPRIGGLRGGQHPDPQAESQHLGGTGVALGAWLASSIGLADTALVAAVGAPLSALPVLFSAVRRVVTMPGDEPDVAGPNIEPHVELRDGEPGLALAQTGPASS